MSRTCGSRAERDPATIATGLRFERGLDGTRWLQSKCPLVGQFNVANLLGVLGVMLRVRPRFRAGRGAGCRNCFRRQDACSDRADAGEPLAVIDYAHTPDALAKALAALRPLATRARRKHPADCGWYSAPAATATPANARRWARRPPKVPTSSSSPVITRAARMPDAIVGPQVAAVRR